MSSKKYANCENCSYYQYDEYCDYYVCMMSLDQDEMERFIKGTFYDCPYFSLDDEYKIVRRQM